MHSGRQYHIHVYARKQTEKQFYDCATAKNSRLESDYELQQEAERLGIVCFLGDIMQTKDLSNASEEAKTDQNVDLYCNITRLHTRIWSNHDLNDFRGLCRQMLAQSPRHGRLQRSNGTLRRKTSIHRAFKQVTRKVLEKFGSNRPSARHHFLVPSSKV